MKLPFAFGLAATALFLQACNVSISLNGGKPAVQGSGIAKTETRAIEPFDELSLDLSANVEVLKGDEPKVTITADDNLLPIIATEVRDGILRIRSTQSYSTKTKLQITLTTAALTKAAVHGSGNIRVQALHDQEFEAIIAGSGNIDASGSVTSLHARIDGSGDLRLGDVQAKHAEVRINGSGDVRLYATDSLDARINGSGDIAYGGNPKKVSSQVNGSGRVARTD